MLQRTDRLRRMRDFALLSQKGRVVYAPFFTLRLRQSQEPTRVGFVATTKLFKRAHDRNRVKRRMRETLRLIKDKWPKNIDLLFIIKAEVKTVPFKELEASVLHAFEKIPEALTKPAPARRPKAKRKSSVVYQGKEK